MVGISFFLKNCWTTKAKFWDNNFLPLEFKCRLWVVKWFLSKFNSNIFTFDWSFIIFCTCLLNLVTFWFTQDSGNKSCLWGELINTTFSSLFTSTNSDTDFTASFIESQQENHNEHRTAVIYMDSKITLGSIRSPKNHNHPVEKIRKRAVTLNKKNWKIEFKWVKAHTRIYRNEIEDQLAKEATQNYYVTYSRIPKSAIKKNARKECIRKWQSQWEEAAKEVITKEFFPSIEWRLAVNLNLSPKVTKIMTGHGNIQSYLHRLKIIGSPECPCKHGIQTVDHLIFQCKRLENKREHLKNSVLTAGNRPVSKSELTNRNLKQFINYMNLMELYKINHSNKQM